MSNRIRDELADILQSAMGEQPSPTSGIMQGDLATVVTGAKQDIANGLAGLDACQHPEKGVHSGMLKDGCLDHFGLAMTKLATILAIGAGGGTVTLHLAVTPKNLGAEKPTNLNWYCTVEPMPRGTDETGSN